MRDSVKVMGSVDCKSWWDQRIVGGGSEDGVKAGNSGGDGQSVTPEIVIMEEL